jgi:hypothetical protein
LRARDNSKATAAGIQGANLCSNPDADCDHLQRLCDKPVAVYGHVERLCRKSERHYSNPLQRYRDVTAIVAKWLAIAVNPSVFIANRFEIVVNR